jgi:glycosyltransferase involved in cell wall biosynthesis
MFGREKFDICMPTFNGEKHVGAAIESVKAQTEHNWRLWIMDDVSTDNTCDVVSRFSEKDSRITLFRSDENRGAPALRNILVSKGEAPYLIFLDQDDLLDCRSLEARFYYAQKVGTAVLSCTVGRIDDRGCILRENRDESGVRRIKAIKRRAIFAGHPIKLCSASIPRDVHEKVGGFREIKGGEEWCYWNDIANKGVRFYVIPSVLSYYRTHCKNTSKVHRCERNWNWIENILKDRGLVYEVFGILLSIKVYLATVRILLKEDRRDKLCIFLSFRLRRDRGFGVLSLLAFNKIMPTIFSFLKKS